MVFGSYRSSMRPASDMVLMAICVVMLALVGKCSLASDPAAAVDLSKFRIDRLASFADDIDKLMFGADANVLRLARYRKSKRFDGTYSKLGVLHVGLAGNTRSLFAFGNMADTSLDRFLRDGAWVARSPSQRFGGGYDVYFVLIDASTDTGGEGTVSRWLELFDLSVGDVSSELADETMPCLIRSVGASHINERTLAVYLNKVDNGLPARDIYSCYVTGVLRHIGMQGVVPGVFGDVVKVYDSDGPISEEVIVDLSYARVPAGFYPNLKNRVLINAPAGSSRSAVRNSVRDYVNGIK